KDRSPKLGSPARSAAERIEAIVEAAERAAESVIDDAEAQAAGYLSEAEAEADRVLAERLAALSELTDSLLEQADTSRRQTESMVELLEHAKERMETRAEPARRSHLSAVAAPEDPVSERNTASAPRREGDPGTPAGARLLATQMAISGS